MINAQTNHSIETMKVGVEMDLSTIRMETGETLEIFLVLHRLKGEITQRQIHTAKQELINLEILLSADLIIDRRVASHVTNKNFHKTLTRRHPMWSALLQPTIP